MSASNRSGWWFLGALTAVSLALAFLQYRWTGEVSLAQEERARADLALQVERIGEALHGQLRGQVRQLLPRADELDALGWQRAHIERYREWSAQDDGRLFAQIGVARPGPANTLDLYLLKEGRFAPAPWPPIWKGFREAAIKRLRSQEESDPPFAGVDADWMEIPVFGEGGEREWMLMELDMSYVRTSWLPALVNSHLNAASFVFRVLRANGSSIAGDGRPGKPDAEAGLFGERGEETRWKLQVWHRDGSLEAAMRSARWRNLAISGALLALIIAAGLALLEYNRRARHTLTAERRFFASVSHELRTPLTAIRAAGQSLAGDVVRGEEQRRQYADIIVRQAEQLSDLVDQVLHFSAVGAGTGSVNIPAVLESAREAASGDLRAAACEVEMNIPKQLPIVRGDAAALRRLFQNLLSNAARHGGQGKWVGVSAVAGNGYVVVRVCDRGPGFPEGDLTQLFEPFFRGETARSRQTRGVGIGLALVREIAEAHGGTVTAANDSGAVFTVRLPEAKE